MAVLGWLEMTAFSVWVREGDTIWAFPAVLTLHTFGLGLLVGASAVVNLRLLGIGRRMPLAPMRPLFSVMWIGFWLNLVTGSMLFAAEATQRGPSMFFWTKLLFVAIGVASTVLIKRAAFDASEKTAPPPRLLASLSLLSWTSAIVAGRLLAYV